MQAGLKGLDGCDILKRGEVRKKCVYKKELSQGQQNYI